MYYITDQVAIGTLQEAMDQERHRVFGFQSFLGCSRHGLPVIPGPLYGLIKIDDGIPWQEDQKSRVGAFVEMGLLRGKVFIYSDHCLSRAPSAAYFYLLSTGLSQQEALKIIQEKCPPARIHPESIHGIETQITPVPMQEILPQEVTERGPIEPTSLSIVVVTFNRKNFVKACLESLLKTTSKPYDLIVVDNGSQDGTLEYLRSLGNKIYLVELGQNCGKGKAANIGFSLATGEWLCYFDSDIVVPPGWFETIKESYKKIPQVGWLSLPYETTGFKEEDVDFQPAFEEVISGGMVFMRRSLLEELGGFPSDRLYGMMDLEYAKNTRLKGYEVGFAHSRKIIQHLGIHDDPSYIGWKKVERFEPSPSPGPENPQVVEIIMVRFNLPELEKQCIQALTDYTDWPIHLTVVDNYKAGERLGVLWNRLIEASRCPLICLLNSDCLVTPGWMEKMYQGFMSDGLVAVVGPSTNHCGTVQAIARGLEPEKALEYAKIVAQEYTGQREEAELSGFCYLVRKDVWNQVGQFSKEFSFYGQETELNVRIRQAGFKLLWCKDAFVYHYGAASIKAAEQRGEQSEKEERSLGGTILALLRGKHG